MAIMSLSLYSWTSKTSLWTIMRLNRFPVSTVLMAGGFLIFVSFIPYLTYPNRTKENIDSGRISLNCTEGSCDTDKTVFVENLLGTSASFQLQTRAEILDDIQNNWLKPPSTLEYAFQRPDLRSDDKGSVRRLHSTLRAIFKNKRNGFFIECGAYDGVFLSNSLSFELDLDWTGILIEADPKNYAMLAQKHRKAWIINACAAIRPYPEKIKMTRINGAGAWTSVSEDGLLNNIKPGNGEFETQCFPLTSILAAVSPGLTVDYLSLDVENAELRILKTVPWEHVHIKVMSIEMRTPWMAELRAFLQSKGYILAGSAQGPWQHDDIFIHQKFQEDESGLPIPDVQGRLSNDTIDGLKE